MTFPVRMMQVEIWQLITFLVGLAITVASAMLAAGRMLLSQVEARLDLRLSSIEQNRIDDREGWVKRLMALDGERRDEMQQWQRVERDLLSLRADLPLHYVRREDYVRGQTVIEAKIDAVAISLQNLQLKSVQRRDHKANENETDSP